MELKCFTEKKCSIERNTSKARESRIIEKSGKLLIMRPKRPLGCGYGVGFHSREIRSH